MLLRVQKYKKKFSEKWDFEMLFILESTVFNLLELYLPVPLFVSSLNDTSVGIPIRGKVFKLLRLVEGLTISIFL